MTAMGREGKVLNDKVGMMEVHNTFPIVGGLFNQSKRIGSKGRQRRGPLQLQDSDHH